MSDRTDSTAAGPPADTPSTAPPPVDWTDDGILRGAFLALFDPADREVLRRAGAILACQAIAGDEGGEFIVRDLRAAGDDARMLARHLQQIAEMRHGSGDTTDRQHALCLLAERWQRNAADIAFEIRGEVEEAPGEPAGALGPEEAAAARLLVKMRETLAEARNLQRLDRDGVIGRSVGNLAEGLAALEAAIQGGP
jgi:hypothetical protein